MKYFSDLNDAQVRWETLDMYAFFYRKYFANGAIGRFSSGFTGEGDALLGVDLMAPLTSNFAFEGGFNYRIPDGNTDAEDDDDRRAALNEGWGITLNLVWYPGYKSPCSSRNPYRPMFGVADNTTLFLNQRNANVD